LAVSALARSLRRADQQAADRVTQFVANSAHVAARIASSYGRGAKVVYPPVDVERLGGNFEQGDHAVAVARLYPYKRVDLAIAACNRMRLPLEVIGEGPDRPRLEALAGPTVRFRGWLPEEEKNRVVASARVLVAPQVEDFGIATVEAIALGTPVLALRRGGAVEIVEEGVSGSFFDEQSADALVQSLKTFDENRFDRRAMRTSTMRFAPERFVRSMREIALEAMSG
jgi:glycosyltransferase involved in cell wall biosynthesis